VQFELQQQLPFELADAVWHHRWLNGADRQAGGRAGLLASLGAARRRVPHAPGPAVASAGAGAVVAAMRRPLLDERLSCCRRAGLAVEAVAASPVAILNAWSAQGGRAGEPAAGLLNVMDERTAEWIIRTPGSFRVIPVDSPSPETFTQELAGSWEALRSQETEIPTRIWLIGASGLLASLEQDLSRVLGTAVERFDARSLAQGRSDQLEPLERCAAAAGLALQGLGGVSVPINLLTGFQQDERSRRGRRVSAIASGICVAAALGLGVSGMLEVRRRRAGVLEALEQRERLYRTLRPEVRALLRQQEYTEGRSRQLAQLIVERFAVTELLARIAQALPVDIWLTKLECGKSRLPTAPEGRADIMDGLLEGRARSFQDVTRFFDQLKQVAGITAVKPLSTSVVTDGADGREAVAFAVQVQRPLESAAPPGGDKAAAPDGEDAE